MGQHVSRTDYEHTDQDVIHTRRRKEILKKHPEVKTLFGPDPMLAFWVILIVLFQVASLFFVYHLNWLPFLLMAYCIGGTLNHSLTLAIHEISHNLAFGHRYPIANRALGIIANLPIGLPMSISFRTYHMEHHKELGVPYVDADVPSELEAKLFCTTLGKLVWMIFQPLFFAFRPLLTNPQPLTFWMVVNIVVQVAFDAAILYFFDFRTLMYLIGGTIMAMGLHPTAGHFIAEHYMFVKGQETFSYYGPLNMISFNVGYHNEHHDFPYIAYSRLPKLRAMLPQYYDHLPRHESWVKVIYDFITDPAIGPYARVVRDKHQRSLLERQRAARTPTKVSQSLVEDGALHEDSGVSTAVTDTSTKAPDASTKTPDSSTKALDASTKAFEEETNRNVENISTSDSCAIEPNGDVGTSEGSINKSDCCVTARKDLRSRDKENFAHDVLEEHLGYVLNCNDSEHSSSDEPGEKDISEILPNEKEATSEGSVVTRRAAFALKA